MYLHSMRVWKNFSSTLSLTLFYTCNLNLVHKIFSYIFKYESSSSILLRMMMIMRIYKKLWKLYNISLLYMRVCVCTWRDLIRKYHIKCQFPAYIYAYRRKVIFLKANKGTKKNVEGERNVLIYIKNTHAK